MQICWHIWFLKPTIQCVLLPQQNFFNRINQQLIRKKLTPQFEGYPHIQNEQLKLSEITNKKMQKIVATVATPSCITNINCRIKLMPQQQMKSLSYLIHALSPATLKLTAITEIANSFISSYIPCMEICMCACMYPCMCACMYPCMCAQYYKLGASMHVCAVL